MTSIDAEPGWVIADVWETVARIRPSADCIVQGETRLTWADFDSRADAMAATLLRAGLRHQSKVAFFVRNSPAFFIGVFACLKVGLVPVNTNFRYRADEAAQLWTDSDAECVVFSADLVEVAAAARPSVPRVRSWLRVADGVEPMPEWATEFGGAPVAPVASGSARASWPRDPDDLILLYTGGTTGAPKGVMWRQDDVFAILNSSGAVRYQSPGDLAAVADLQASDQRPRPRFLPCGPLIHGTAGFASYGVLGAGGTVILLGGRAFDPSEALDAVEREQVTHLGIVGDAHARPILERLDAEPGRWDLSSLRLVTSAGMLLSEGVRAALLRHVPDALCVDLLGSSEIPTIGRARSTATSLAPAATFVVGANVRVLDDQDHDVHPGSDEVGVLAVKGRHPLGYYKDAAKSATLFRVLEGERWSVTGDLALVRTDGAIQLLGRGTGVINTGGEKVYPREVEDALMRQPGLVDVAVVGLPHELLGQVVVAAVQVQPGTAVDPDEVLSALRHDLAGYKVPKRLHVLDSLDRNDAGKLKYPALVERLRELDAARADC